MPMLWTWDPGHGIAIGSLQIHQYYFWSPRQRKVLKNQTTKHHFYAEEKGMLPRTIPYCQRDFGYSLYLHVGFETKSISWLKPLICFVLSFESLVWSFGRSWQCNYSSQIIFSMYADYKVKAYWSWLTDMAVMVVWGSDGTGGELAG